MVLAPVGDITKWMLSLVLPVALVELDRAHDID